MATFSRLLRFARQSAPTAAPRAGVCCGLPVAAPAVVLLVAFAASTALGATKLVLREQANVAGPVLLLGDLADIHSADAELVASLASTPLGPATPGQRFLRVAEIRDLLLARGIDLSTIQLSGAAVVAIGRRPEKVAAVKSRTPADRKQLAATIENAIEQFLIEQTGVDAWQVDLITQGVVFDQLDDGAEIDVAGGEAPWTGRQQFSLTSPGAPGPVAAAARVQRVSMVVYATTPIEAGQLIRAAQLELRRYVGTPPSTALLSLEAAAGQQARRAIRPDAMLSTSSLRPPLLVRRGETVSVYARTGGVTVRTFATAKQDGALGDLIQVESTASRQGFAARVSGSRELEVYATGTGVDDYALPSPQTARR